MSLLELWTWIKIQKTEIKKISQRNMIQNIIYRKQEMFTY